MAKKIDESTTAALNQLKSAQTDLAHVRRDHLHLERVVRALIEILRETSGLDESALMKIVARIEEEETVYGGVVFKEAAQCSSCKRPVQEGNKTCIYCGEDVSTLGLF